MVSFAALLVACGIVWRTAVKPTVEALHEIVDTIRGIKALIEPDEDGRTLPSRMSALEAAMDLFLNRLGPMVETIARLAGPAPRTKGTR